MRNRRRSSRFPTTSLKTLLDLDAYKLKPVVSFIANLLGHKFGIPIELTKSDITCPGGARFSAKSYSRSRQHYRNPIRRRREVSDNELPWFEKNSGDAHSVILKDWLKAPGQICTDIKRRRRNELDVNNMKLFGAQIGHAVSEGCFGMFGKATSPVLINNGFEALPRS